MNDDSTLLRAYLEHDSEPAFRELVGRHLGLVYATALRRVGGDVQLAEDVCQKVFADFARKSPTLIRHPALSSWLYVSAHVASADAVRREQRRKARETKACTMDPTFESNDTNTDWAQIRPLLDDVLIAVKHDDREAIALRFFEKRSFAEIGAALQVTEDTARKRVDRALEKLRMLLARRGVTSTASALGIALTAGATCPTPIGLAAKIAGTTLMQASVTGGGVSTLMITLKSAAPMAAILAGGIFLLNEQREKNRGLRAEHTRLEAAHQSMGAIREENRRLTQQLAAAERLRPSPAVERPSVRTEPARLNAVAVSAAVVSLNPQGTIRWDNDYLSLREFLQRLQALHTNSSHLMPKITFRFDPNTQASAIGYVVEEARKAAVEVEMIPNRLLEPPVTGSWF